MARGGDRVRDRGGRAPGILRLAARPAGGPVSVAAGARRARRRQEHAMTGESHPFEYAVLRVVPRVDRGEAINAGVLVYCRPLRFLRALVDLDADRLLALDPAADVEAVRQALEAIVAVCEEPDSPAGQRGAAAEAGQAGE